MNLKDKISEKIDKIGEQNKIADKAKSMSNNLVEWASNNRKKMFVITISFLLFSVIMSVIYTTISIKRSKAARENYSIMYDSIRQERKQNPNKTYQFQQELLDYKTLKEYESEIENLLEKDSLTSEDSLRVYELYNILIEQGLYE